MRMLPKMTQSCSRDHQEAEGSEYPKLLCLMSWIKEQAVPFLNFVKLHKTPPNSEPKLNKFDTCQ